MKNEAGAEIFYSKSFDCPCSQALDLGIIS